tara:strand:- start:1385 stop:1843 length:459 start_codon:yes stop_codon:yes gene_type:complete
MSEEVKNQELKNKSILGNLKSSVGEKEEQLEILSTFVRLAILVWSGGILTLAYIKLPVALGIPEQKLDPTFIASVFTGVLATFGVQAAKKAGENGGNGGGISKEDLQKLIDAAAQTAPSQTIRVEQGPIRIANGEPPIKPVPIDPPKPPYSL